MKRFYFSVLLMFGICSGLFSANYYWVGGTGNWPDYTHHWATSSGGQLFHMQVPGANDTVIFDTLSFVAPNDTVYADSSILYCYSMKWTNVQFHPVFANASFATNTILKIYGSLQLDTGMTWSFSGLVRFYGLHPGNTIRTANLQLGSLEFCGDTIGSWSLLDTLKAGNLNFATGIFRTNGQPVYCYSMYFGSYNYASVLLDTSFIEIHHLMFAGPARQFDADSTVIHFLGSAFTGGDYTFGKVIFETNVGLSTSSLFEEAIFKKGAFIPQNNSFRRLFMPNDGNTIVINSGVTVTIIDTIAISGTCHSMNAVYSSGPAPGFLNMVSGVINIDHMVLDALSTSGAAVFNASNCFTNGNCSGWNFVSPIIPRNLFWVGGSGDWNDSAHWSASSGGTGGECPPTPADSVYVDAFSFPGTGDTLWTHLPTIFCHQFNWQNAAGNSFVHGASLLQSYGSFRLSSLMNEHPGSIVFRDAGPNTIIDPAGQPMSTIYFLGSGNRSFVSAAASYGNIEVMRGSVHTSGYPINCSAISISAGTQVDFAGSAIDCDSYGCAPSLISAPSIITTKSFSENAGGFYPKLVFPNEGTLSGTGTQFGFVSFNGNSIINGNCSYDTLLFLASGADISLSSSSTQVINDSMAVNSSCTGMTFLHSDTEGSAAHIFKNSGSIVLSDLIMEDMDAAGSGSFNALNSVAIANVTGWNITPPPAGPMYWIGGTGNWNDPQHWSPASGGAPGNCIPNPTTDVFFDSSSFVGNNDQVQINIPYAYCRNMIWNGTNGNPEMVDIANGNLLRCYGSFVLDSNVTASQSIIHFRSVAQGNTINGNNQLIGHVDINGVGGSWTLAGDLRAGELKIERGCFKTAGYTIDAMDVIVGDSTILDSSAVFAQTWMAAPASAVYFDEGTSEFAISGQAFAGGNGQHYNQITFAGDVTIYNNDSISFARFTGMTNIQGNTVFDSVFFDNPGQQISISSGTTQTITGKITCASTAALPIGIESSLGFLPAAIFKTADTVCLDFLNLRGITAGGGAVFYSGSNSSDAGNNSGWTWNSCVITFVNVWPGDANRDLTADNIDLLAIGIAFGKTGPARANASLNWVAQPAYAWNTLFANTSDIVNADCDGDGVVGYSDTTAILLNYGLTHPARLPSPDSVQSAGPKLWMSTPQFPVSNGDTASVGIMLGTANLPANNVYGIAFQMNYNDSNIVPGTIWIEFNGSWMCPSGNEVHLLKHFPGQLILMVAISRIDHSNFSGYGEIARIHFQTTPGYFGWFKSWFTDVHLIDASENPQPVTSQLGAFNIVGMDENSVSGFYGYPNPTHGTYTIADENLAGNKTVIIVMDMAERIVQQEEAEITGTFTLHLEGLPAGTYFITLQTESGIYRQRVVKE